MWGVIQRTLLKAKIPPVEETTSPQCKSLATLEETTRVRAVLEQEQRSSGVFRDRRTTGNEKNKLHETAADLAHEYHQHVRKVPCKWSKTLNEEWAKKETKMEKISKDGSRWY
ncbi:hypothetical protein ACOSQ2_019420 [Xanthoceras sorbifolium]